MGRSEAIPVRPPAAASPPAAGGRASVPTATYRLQLNQSFRFRDAERVVPYLAELGIGALYVSPFFQAGPDSVHGYDVTDYGRLNPQIGDDADLAALAAALHRHGLGQIVDFVPNHMGIAAGRNAWWQDVLENGEVSPFAEFFDIEWRPLKPELRRKVLLPILGDQYGAVLERGELELRLAAGAFTVWYHEAPLPIAPPTYPLILRNQLDSLLAELPANDPHLLEFQSIITALERLPGQDERDPLRLEERQREQVVAKRRLAELVTASQAIAAAIATAVRAFNGEPGNPGSFALLDDLLAAQSYRLAYWRVAAEEINYRRFFAINELAAIRQEVPDVFAASHAFLLRLLTEGVVSGVRIDHPDGLWNPAGYFRQLQEAYRAAVAGDGRLSAPEATGVQGGDLPLYLVVEKVLEHGEALPEDWAVHGTVGYEFAAAVNGLFVDGRHRRAFDQLYAGFLGGKTHFADLVYESKYLMMRIALVSEVNVLAQALNRISEQDRHTRDFTLNTLRAALRETIANFPVYRTYIVCDEGTLLDRDRRYVEAAIAQAKRRNPTIDASVLDFVRDVLLSLPNVAEGADAVWRERCRFGMKFQQLTAPVMAKGVEDTAFYRSNRLVSLNEVGGDPAHFGTTVAAFHRQNAERLRRWPDAMLTTSTHDTKRSEDVRARISVLSELPRDWRVAINRWARLNRRHKTRLDGRPAPDRNDEYLLYQTLLGAWPAGDETAGSAEFGQRIADYLEKAMREAQVHTSWVTPNADYEAATRRFIEAILDPAKGAGFLTDFAGLRRTVTHFGAFNALAQQVLKLTSPGVPDIYQGTELWDLSLVDPDNRRPVDFDRRRRVLRALRRRRVSPRLARELVETKDDGRVKLFVTRQALTRRRDHADLFAIGDYVPLAADGAAADHVCAFARRLLDQQTEVVVVVPRLVVGLCRGELIAPLGKAVWGETRLVVPGSAGGARYRNLFTGETIRATPVADGAALALADVFGTFPVALLERIGDD